jgi:hypothetical protein
MISTWRGCFEALRFLETEMAEILGWLPVGVPQLPGYGIMVMVEETCQTCVTGVRRESQACLMFS